MTETIVACTDDSGTFDAGLAAVVERARADGARLVLYDVAAAGAWTSPRPNQWAGEGDAEQYDHPLDPVELEKLGRHNVALKVARAREQGVDAYGWLPDRSGGGALADYARRTGARLILVPSGLDAPELLDSLPATAPVEYVG